MSSRQEEKERRKRERQEREAAERAKAARAKRMRMVLGGAVGAAVVAALIVVLVVVVLGGDDPDDVAVSNTSIPALKEGDVKKAAELAKCTYEPKLPNEGSGHEEKDFKASDYKQNPPTSGNHFPQWYEDGIYSPGDTPELGKLVHTLEHGRIDIQYKPGTDARTVAQLETLYNEMDGGHHLLLFENTTGMKAAVAATAWDASLTCDTMSPQVFDAIRGFRKEHIDKGPEVVP